MQSLFFSATFWACRTANSRLNNYTRIEPTLHLLGVPFDAGFAQALMQEVPGAATRLLYQLYVLLEKKRRAGLTGAIMETMQPAATAHLHRTEREVYNEVGKPSLNPLHFTYTTVLFPLYSVSSNQFMQPMVSALLAGFLEAI